MVWYGMGLVNIMVFERRGSGWGILHQEINTPEFIDAAVDGLLKGVDAADVDAAHANDFGAGAGGGDVFGDGGCFLFIAADDAGVGAEVDEGADLGGADAAVAAGAEDHFVREDVVFPDVGEVVGFGEGHGEGGGC